MKRTSQELLDFYGLKVGDIVKLFKGEFEVKLDDLGMVIVESKYGVKRYLQFLIDEEYEIIKHKPQLTEDEKVILRNLPKEYKWITRDLDDDALSIHEDKPDKEEGINYNYWLAANSSYLNYDHLFQFITWEDEPYLIEDLLK